MNHQSNNQNDYSIDTYKNKYYKYKKKYLEAKKLLGGATALYQSPPPKMSVPNYGYTSKTDRHYNKFYEGFTDNILQCIYDKSYRIGLSSIERTSSGLYFKFDQKNYLSIHTNVGLRGKFHINQQNFDRSLQLAISYDDYGDLKIIKKFDDTNFWRKVDERFKDLLDIIEICVNSNKPELRRGPLNFADVE